MRLSEIIIKQVYLFSYFCTTLQNSVGVTIVSLHSTHNVLSGAALAVILAIAVAIGLIIFLVGLVYIRRFGPASYCVLTLMCKV